MKTQQSASDILKDYADGKYELIEVFGDPILVDKFTKHVYFASDEVREELNFYLDLIVEKQNTQWSGDSW